MYKKVIGEVIHGKKLWRTIWFPTANLFLASDSEIPEWTYCVNWLIHGSVYRWAATFRKSLELFEVHFFDFNQDIYGVEIEIMIYSKIRGNMQFSCLEEIKEQITKDVSYAKKLEHTVLSFGTFDILHPWHGHYLNSAKMYGTTLVTIVATSENREKITWNRPTKNLEERIKLLKWLCISDIIEKGSNTDPMQWIARYDPKVICLWYDQNSFSSELEDYLEFHPKFVRLVRIDSLSPEKYKSSKFKNTLSWKSKNL